MWVGKYVRVEKLQPCSNPDYPTPDKYFPNIYQGIPIGYCVEGVLKIEPKIGQHILLHRTVRNGEVINGIFTTSIVNNMVEENNTLVITTNNSVYVITEVAG